MLHLLCCLSSALGIVAAALTGLYGTVAYFHSRLESTVGILIGTTDSCPPPLLSSWLTPLSSDWPVRLSDAPCACQLWWPCTRLSC